MRMRKRRTSKMEERIRSQLKDSKPEEVESLNLDNVRASELSGLSDEYVRLKRISVINVGLTSLQGLPALPALEILEMGDNKLSGGLEVLTKCPSLKEINLCGNRIATFDDLKALSELKNLLSLDLLDCPVTQQERYRERVFELLPSLEALDGLDREGKEIEDSDDDDDDEAWERAADDSGSEDDEPGLEYLQKEIGSGSSSDEDDYDPDKDHDNAPEDDDDIIPSSEEEGPSSSKKPRLDPASKPPPSTPSDSD